MPRRSRRAWLLPLLVAVLLVTSLLPVAEHAAFAELTRVPVDPAAERVDLTGDGVIDQTDVQEAVMAWTVGREDGAPCAARRAQYDVTGDGCVTIADIQSVAARVGTALSPETVSGLDPHANATVAATVTYVVDSTGDQEDATPGDGICRTAAGTCTLRAAMTEANLDRAPSLIRFAIPGTGPHTIAITTELPTLSDSFGPTTIDGYSQPGASPNTHPTVSNAIIRIQIAGVRVAGSFTTIDAIRITSANNRIQGLAFLRLRRSIWISGRNATGNVIAGNFVGAGANGQPWYDQINAVENRGGDPGGFGIWFSDETSNNRIGGTAPADRNVISGNANDGIGMRGDRVSNHVVYGNLIGLNPSGTDRLRNWGDGIDLNYGASSNVIGGLGPGERNVISGNHGEGIELSHDPSTANNRIAGNYIGTDPTGNSAIWDIRNTGYAISLEDGVANNDIGPGNVLSNNGKGGIEIYGAYNAGNRIFDNWIGITPNGTLLPNQGHAIRIRFNATRQTVGPGNIITGNNGAGVYITDSSVRYNTVTRNSIYGNTGLGIDIDPIGVNENDQHSKSGPNDRLNFPVITLATTEKVSGTACPNCTVEVFIADGGAGQYGAGKTYLGSTMTAADGTFGLGITGVTAGAFVTSTATDSSGNTSEFSRNVMVAGAGPPAGPLALPGTFEVEDYRAGGEGVGYHDTTPGNAGGVYRADDVDIQPCTDPASSGSCFSVGWVEPGEWLAYDVRFDTPGYYTFDLRVATPSNNRRYRVELNGSNVTGSVTFNSTGGWQVWGNAKSIPVQVAAGTYTLRIVAENGGWNMNFLTVAAASAPDNPPTVAITNPTAGQTVSGAVTIQIDAQDDVTARANLTVEVSIDGGAWLPASWSAAAGRHERAWDTTTVAPGSHTLRARATDARSQTTISAPVSVTVNPPPAARFDLPGTIQLEDYHAAYDTTPGNAGGAYRTGDVDIQPCTDPTTPAGQACYNIGWTDAGEWLEYNVRVATAGYYAFTVRYSTPSNNRVIRLRLNGQDLSGPLPLPNTGGWQNWSNATTPGLQLAAGDHTLRVMLDTGNLNLNSISVAATAAPPPPAPRITTLPGVIQAEEYADGGEGVGYHDTTPGNAGGLYRNDDVDIQLCTDPQASGTCYHVGWIDAGEWLAYRVTVPTARNYTFAFRYATPASSPRRVRIEVDGVTISGPILLPSTGGWHTWATFTTAPLPLPAGEHTLTIVFELGGFNFNHVTVE
jgi:CSLREA domain-containing protein